MHYITDPVFMSISIYWIQVHNLTSFAYRSKQTLYLLSNLNSKK